MNPRTQLCPAVNGPKRAELNSRTRSPYHRCYVPPLTCGAELSETANWIEFVCRGAWARPQRSGKKAWDERFPACTRWRDYICCSWKSWRWELAGESWSRFALALWYIPGKARDPLSLCLQGELLKGPSTVSSLMAPSLHTAANTFYLHDFRKNVGLSGWICKQCGQYVLARTLTWIFCIYRTCILHVFTFLVRQRVMAAGSAGDGRAYVCWSVCELLRLSARIANRNILSTSLPGSPPSVAAGGASLCSHITASGPNQGAERPNPPSI